MMYPPNPLAPTLLPCPALCRLPHYTPQQLANTVWALACLHAAPPPAWAAEFQRASAAALSGMRPQEISMVLLSLAKLGMEPDRQWLAAFEAAALRQLPRCRPQHLSNMAWALTRLPTAALPARLARALAQEAVARFAAASSGNAMREMAGSGDGAGSSALGGRNSEAFTPQGLAMLAWALARLQPQVQIPSSYWEGLLAAAAPHLPAADAHALTALLWAAANVGLPPHGAWADAALRAAAAPGVLQGFTAQGLALTLWAVARLGPRPAPEQLLPLVARAGELLSTAADGHAAAVTLHALAALGFYPGSAWTAAWLEASQPRLRTWAARDLAQALWALAALQEVPPPGWMAAWSEAWAGASTGAVATGGDRRMAAIAQSRLRQQRQQARAASSQLQQQVVPRRRSGSRLHIAPQH